MSPLEILFWIGVVYFAVFVFCFFGFAIITDGFSNTSKRFSRRVFVGSLVFSIAWLPAACSILLLWAVGEFAEE